MAYSELIKDFSRIREYMRQFYIFGFKGRNEFDAKSARSYDNEKRRIESWLGEYMAFRQESSGKKVFLSMDSRDIPQNPLYQAFKTKSFTSGDIMLHFYILDILEDGCYSAGEIADIIASDYISILDDLKEIDESTVRKKLKEYEALGLLTSSKEGKKVLYQKTVDSVDLRRWQDAISFYTEDHPLGVIGSYFSQQEDTPFSFKHRYFLHALDSEILYQLLTAIDEDRNAVLRVEDRRHLICPIKILISVQNGRQYIMAYNLDTDRIAMFRLDHIDGVDLKGKASDKARLKDLAAHTEQRMWGVSLGDGKTLEHVEMILDIEPEATHILKRLHREKRQGEVKQIANSRYMFSVDCYDAWELVPWMRSFFGRIVSVSSTNKTVETLFAEDMEKMFALYEEGGEDDAVS